MKSNSMRRGVKVLLTFIFALGLFLVIGPESKVNAASVTLKNPLVSGDVSTWDCIWFGSYPQTEILPGNSTYTSLQNASGWDANDEITLNGVKYRRMQKGHATSSAYSGRDGYYNWSDSTTWHYFRYEPIKWRVLESGNQLLLLADKALDTKQHISEENWSQSSIRAFLNSAWCGRNGFIGSAFTTEQQGVILETAHKDKVASADPNVDTTDKVYVPSLDEVKNINYGFSSNASRQGRPTNYASAMGTRTFSSGTCRWALRRYFYPSGTGRYDGIYGVSENGGAGSSFYASDVLFGIRPMMSINASRTDLYYYAGTVSSNGAVNEVAIPSNNTLTNNNNNSGNNNSATSTAVPKKAKIKKVQLSGRRTLKITIKRDKDASGYQIQYSTSKKFKNKKTKSVNLKKNKKTTKTIKKLKSGKKYYVRVRSYKKVKSGNSVTKVYGSWSKTVKSKKVK